MAKCHKPDWSLKEYSQVPNKWVGPNKRVGWLLWANFINKWAQINSHFFHPAWLAHFSPTRLFRPMKFAQNNNPTFFIWNKRVYSFIWHLRVCTYNICICNIATLQKSCKTWQNETGESAKMSLTSYQKSATYLRWVQNRSNEYITFVCSLPRQVEAVWRPLQEQSGGLTTTSLRILVSTSPRLLPPPRLTVGQIPPKCKETSNLMWLPLIWFILVLFVC